MSEFLSDGQPSRQSRAPRSRLGGRNIFVVEGSGVRSTLATVAPLIVGQVIGNPGMGLLLGIGGLQTSFADMDGATTPTLLWATAGSACAGLLGALVSRSPAAVASSSIFVLAFGLNMLAAFGDVAANVGFVVTISYALMQSRPASLAQGETTFLMLALGGLWSVLLTLILWRLRRRLGDLKAGDPTIEPGTIGHPISSEPRGTSPNISSRPAIGQVLRPHMTPRSLVFRHAVRVGIATAAAVAISRWLRPPHAFWLVLTVVVILKPDFTATRRRTIERLIGTVLGGALAMLPATYVTNTTALDILLIAFGILAFSHLPRNYGLYAFFLTPFIVLLSTIAAPHESGIALARISQTVFGGALAFGLAFLLRSPRNYWPIRLR